MEVLTLEKICEAKSSNIAQKDLENNNGCYPIYGASGFIKNVDFYKFERPYLAIVKDGAGVGRVMSLPGKSSIIGTMQAILPNDNIDIDYLFYYLKSKNLGKYYTGATIPHIYFKDYKKEKCNVYSLEEQRIVSKKLKLIDSMIDYKNKQIEQLNQLIKSQFVEMFGDINMNNKNFEESKLSSYVKVIGGYAFKSKDFKEEGIPVLRIGNINAGYFRPKDLMFWNEDSKLENYVIYPGDVVMSLTGTVGKDDYGNICIMSNDYEKYYLNQRNAKLILNDELDKCYITYALRIPEIKKRLTGISRGVRQANISNKDIENLVIPIPPTELQNKFAQIVEQIDKQKFEFENSLKKLEELQASLMQEYFG